MVCECIIGINEALRSAMLHPLWENVPAQINQLACRGKVAVGREAFSQQTCTTHRKTKKSRKPNERDILYGGVLL